MIEIRPITCDEAFAFIYSQQAELALPIAAMRARKGMSNESNITAPFHRRAKVYESFL